VEGTAPGLRERNRQERHDRIRAAALALFLERGFDAVTVEEIADRAVVSPSTLFRYFPTKEDLLVGDDARRLDALRDAFADRPEGEPVLAAMRAALMALADAFQVDGPDMVRRYSVIRETPSLTARILEQQSAREDTLAAAIAQRMQPEPTADLRARVLAATGLALLRVAMREWINEDTEGELSELVAEALDLLARELEPIPAR
jgi:AcrR family transcriptional regulator